MKKFFALLLFFVCISNLWAQLPTPTPNETKPNLVLKSSNLNFQKLVPPLKVYYFDCESGKQYSGNPDFEEYSDSHFANRLLNVSVSDSASKNISIFKVHQVGNLWEATYGNRSEQVEAGTLFFEELKVEKIIDAKSVLVKCPMPDYLPNWEYGGKTIFNDHAQFYDLYLGNDTVSDLSLKNGDNFNAVLRLNGFFPLQKDGKTTNYLKLDLVSPGETNVWSYTLVATPTVQESNEQHFKDSSGNDIEYYPIISLFLEANGIAGKYCGGSFTIIKKINKSGWLVEATADDGVGSATKTFYLKIPRSWDIQTIAQNPDGYGVSSKMVSYTGAPPFRALNCINLTVFVTNKFMKFTNSLDDTEESIRVLELKAIAVQPCM